MSTTKFTYLIGAGASALAIPVIKNFADELAIFADYIESVQIIEDSYHPSFQVDSKPSELKERFINDVIWLAKECKAHSSVDTFARKLYLANRKKELIKLKAVVSEFLLVKQIQNGIDKRYDAFFAALLEKSEAGLILPSNIKILSWNYDKQIEYSIAQFHSSPNDTHIDNFLQVQPRTGKNANNPESFSLFKLNGAIGGTISNGKDYLPMKIDYKIIGEEATGENEQHIIKNILYRFYLVEKRIFHIDYYRNDSLDEYPTIMYSWEKSPIFDYVRDDAFKVTKETEILVIIGYSFPTFNRVIDKKILQNFGHLKKVFIQSPRDTIEGVIQRFKSLYELHANIEIVPIINVDEFYIPYEY
nr:hypothetical protein [uncultured Draconibacterium sp.]